MLDWLLGQLFEDHDRMHRRGLGESPDGLRAYRRNRVIVAVLLIAGALASFALYHCDI